MTPTSITRLVLPGAARSLADRLDHLPDLDLAGREGRARGDPRRRPSAPATRWGRRSSTRPLRWVAVAVHARLRHQLFRLPAAPGDVAAASRNRVVTAIGKRIGLPPALRAARAHSTAELCEGVTRLEPAARGRRYASAAVSSAANSNTVSATACTGSASPRVPCARRPCRRRQPKLSSRRVSASALSSLSSDAHRCSGELGNGAATWTSGRAGTACALA